MFWLFLQRWKAISQPKDEWGPALQMHRDEAWEVHKTHGTTMGGALQLANQSNMNAVKYSTGNDNLTYASEW